MEGNSFWFYLLVALLIVFLLRVFCLQEPYHLYFEERTTTHGHRLGYEDRQGNIFTISDDASLNAGANHYADFFYLEPNSDEAARIRAQLEKDEKDLPSYDEVMGMNNLATPTAGIGLSTSSIATNTTTISGNLPPEVPPYSEIDPIAMATIVPALPATASPALPPPTSAAVVDMTGSTGAAPSTSRAAAAAAAAATTTVTIAPIVNNQSSIV